jgi:hypothetical protein
MCDMSIGPDDLDEAEVDDLSWAGRIGFFIDHLPVVDE